MNALLFTIVFQGLAILALCCLLRAGLDMLTLPKSSLYQVLKSLTSPILKITSFVTPIIIPTYLHIFLSTIWLLLLRVAFYWAVAAFGLLPKLLP